MKRSYSFHDTSIIVRFDNAPGIAGLWHRVLNMLAAYGFEIGRDPRIEKHYSCLGKDHRLGRFGDLHLASERNDQHRWNRKNQGGSCTFEFFQEIVTENRNGGKYDFDKLAKMPYLVRLRFLHARQAIAWMLDAEGIVDESGPVLSRLPALEQLRYKLKGCWHAKGRPIEEWQPDDRSGSNSRDKDGNKLRPGDLRCFYHRGRLMQGRVYYSLNMMWYVVIGPRELTCHAAGEFFAWRPGLPRRKGSDPVTKVQQSLKRAVESQNFERAIVCRDWLKRHSNPQAA